MAQVGEFSFILADNAFDLGIVRAETYNLVLGTAVVSILISPFVARVAGALVPRLEGQSRRFGFGAATVTATGPGVSAADLSRTEQGIGGEDQLRRPTVVVLGAGRVGQVVARAVRNRGFRCLVVDRDARQLEAVERLGAVTIFGDAANPEILRRCELERARILIVAIGDPLTSRLAAERALAINPRLSIGARARGRQQVDVLRGLGVGRLADPDAEAAFELARHALQRMGVSGPELSGIVVGLRRDVYGHDRT
jgi:CPA2 family monovalent cation:H+ antiporter-2